MDTLDDFGTDDLAKLVGLWRDVEEMHVRFLKECLPGSSVSLLEHHVGKILSLDLPLQHQMGDLERTLVAAAHAGEGRRVILPRGTRGQGLRLGNSAQCAFGQHRGADRYARAIQEIAPRNLPVHSKCTVRLAHRLSTLGVTDSAPCH